MSKQTKDWFLEGQEAFNTNKDLIDDCPYDEGSEPCNAWQDGWLAEADKWESNDD